MNVSVLIPYRPDGGPRDRIAEFALARLRDLLPDAEIIHMDDRGDDPDLFNHGQAVNRAANWATGDVFLIADADTTYDYPAELLAALHAANEDRQWRLPQRYIQLDAEATRRSLEYGAVPAPIALEETVWVGDGVSWAGLVIVTREAFELVGGADERYVGHGADDVALGQALNTLYGRCVRYPGAAVHLWHPRDAQSNGAHRADLTAEYDAASGNPDAMRALIEEKRL